MTRWTVVALDNAIGKDGQFYHGLDLSFLPSDILAVQSYDGVTCEIETGDKVKETVTGNQEDVATSSLSWWSSVETTWQTAYDAENA